MPLVDTWTWIEYFDLGKAGPQARAAVEGPEVATSVVSIAELADIYARDGRTGFEERLRFIRSRGAILDVPHVAAARAGPTKWAQRRAKHPMGLMDALIYETALHHGLEVVTGDVGFEGLSRVRWIGGKPGA